MSSESESQQQSRRILEIAVSRGMLTSDSFDEIVDLPGDACDHAISRELIATTDIDLLRPLANPKDHLPGYDFEELIGKGASGAVYRAKQLALGRDVAVKLLKSGSPDDGTVTARSQLEARIGASLQHPGIVTVYDHGVHQQRLYLAMELLEGESLEALIDRNGPIDAGESLKMVRQVVAAMRYANSEGVVHRDIKPANLMLVEDKAGLSDLASGKAVKVTDFGLALNHQQADATRLTVAGATLGTPCYVAPEQLESTDVDQRADIYALGASLFHMLTGKQPFDGDHAFKVLAAKMQGTEDWLSVLNENDSIPVNVRQLVMDMTQSDPTARIPDYETVETRIDAILSGAVTPDETPAKRVVIDTPVERTATTTNVRSGNRWWPVAVGVGALVLGSIGAIHLLSDNGGETPVDEQDAPRTDVSVPSRRATEKSTPFRLLNVFESLPDQRKQGGWRIGPDLESTDVLHGTNGWMRFQILPEHRQTEFYRFRTEIDTSQNPAAVDVCFGFESNGTCYIARVTKDYVQLGRGRVSDENAFGEPVTDAYRQFEPIAQKRVSLSTPHRCIVRVERQPEAWFINVNEKELGGVSAKTSDDPAIYLRANAGTGYFSDIWVTLLKPTPPANGQADGQ